MSVQLNILWIGLSEDLVLEISSVFQAQDFILVGEHVSTTALFSAMLPQQIWDVIISGHQGSEFDSLSSLEILQSSHCDIPFIVVANSIGERATVDLIKAGAHDYLTEHEIDRLPEVVQHALKEAALCFPQILDTEFQLCKAPTTPAFTPPTVGFTESNLLTGQFNRVNAYFCEMTGYTQDELLGMTVADLSYPSDIVAYKQAIQQFSSGNTDFITLEKRYLRKDGGFFWSETTIYLVQFPNEQDTFCLALIQDISDRKQSETLMQNVELGTATTTRQDFFPTLVRYLSCALNVSFVWVTEKVSEGSLHTLAYSTYGVLQRNYTYLLPNTPCERVFETGNLCCLDSLQDTFPADDKLVRLDAQSYVGRALYDSAGHVIGHLCILSTEPLQHLNQVESLLHVFAERAAIEIEHQRTTEVLDQINQSLKLELREQTKALAMTQAAVDLAPACIFLIHPDGSFYYANHAAYSALGYSSAELLTLFFSDIDPTLSVDVWRDRWLELKRKDVLTIESSFHGKDGQCFPVELIINHLQISGQEYAFAFVKDISERLQVQRDNQQLKERLQFLLASNPAVIFSAEPYADFRLTYLSENIEVLSGHKPEYFFEDPLSWEKQVHPDDAPKLYSAFVSLFEEGFYQHEYRFLHREGHYIWIRNGLQLVRDLQGNPVEMIGYVVDVSDFKDVEHELTETNQTLARVTRLKDEFLANMSHELRTPLNAILGMTEGLSEQIFGEINADQLKALKTVEKSSNHLLSLINEILDVARIESGQLELELRQVSVTSLFQSSLALVQQQANSKQIQIQINIPSFLPDVCVDELRMVQALINLLDNAIKFTTPGERIILEAYNIVHSSPTLGSPPTQGCLISVKDSGIGIAPEHLDTLFQPFVQIDSALNRKFSGTGLGLALVRRIVELHLGQVSVTSTVGVGSCFTIELPYLDISDPENDSAILDTSGMLEPSHESPLLLLVEDNDANIMTLTSYLKAKGYRIQVAKNGLEAIAKVESIRPHLVLMDIQMPQMDGFEAMKIIRKNPENANLPIIALTALAMPGDRDRCLAAGANTYITKPIQMRKLVNSIEKCLMPQLV